MTGVACVGCGFCQGDGWVAGVVAAAAWVRLSSAGLEIAVKAEESLSPGALVSAAFTCLEGKSDSETERAAKAIKVATKKRPSAARGSRFIFMGLCGEWVRRRWALLATIALAVPGPRESKQNVPATSLASRARQVSGRSWRDGHQRIAVLPLDLQDTESSLCAILVSV